MSLPTNPSDKQKQTTSVLTLAGADLAGLGRRSNNSICLDLLHCYYSFPTSFVPIGNVNQVMFIALN